MIHSWTKASGAGETFNMRVAKNSLEYMPRCPNFPLETEGRPSTVILAKPVTSPIHSYFRLSWLSKSFPHPAFGQWNHALRSSRPEVLCITAKSGLVKFEASKPVLRMPE